MMKLSACTIATLVLLAPLNADAQTKWFKYERNPVMNFGAPGSWEAWDVSFPRIIRVQDTLKMWYVGEPGFDANSRIGYAWSANGGVSWTKYASNPVLTVTQAWEGSVLYAPYVIFTGTDYKMWYTGFYGPGRIGYASSPDGIHWTKCVANPVLTLGPSTWDAQSVNFPYVLADGTGFKMWYNGYPTGYSQCQVGYATATNETTWTKAESVNPVLASFSGSWNATYVRYPTVLFDGKNYEMWFSGGTHIFLNHQFGYATSPDGIHWTKDAAQNPVLKPGPTAWDAQTMATPDVLFDGSIYHMWYAGFDGTHMRIGYAVSPKGLQATILPSPDVGWGDTVHIVVRADDPKDLSFYAKLESKRGGQIVDSLWLYDDGTHGDSLANDGLFTNRWTAPNQNDTCYVNLGLCLHDTLRFNEVPHFTQFTVPVEPERTSIIPGEFFLGQNYPTPFNPTTTIQYALPQRSHVTLTVFNTLGQQVATLVEGEQESGYHEVIFDGSGLSSGVYFYRFHAGNYVATKKLLMVK
jgi:predicted GH43/DUF377 family glycosyl hydrolase